MMLLKRLSELATKLDKAGLKGSADVIDLLIKQAVNEWKYYGDSSPEDYEDRIKGIRERKGIPPEEVVLEKDRPEVEVESVKPKDASPGNEGLFDAITTVGAWLSHYSDRLSDGFTGCHGYKIEKGRISAIAGFEADSGALSFIDLISNSPGFKVADGWVFITFESDDDPEGKGELWIEINSKNERQLDIYVYLGSKNSGDEYMKEVYKHMVDSFNQ